MERKLIDIITDQTRIMLSNQGQLIKGTVLSITKIASNIA